MIAMTSLKPSCPPFVSQQRSDEWHHEFLSLMPAIVRHSHFAFCNLTPEAHEEAIQDVVANALVVFVRLYEQGRSNLAYAGALARYAVARIRDGRHVGQTVNSNDVTSRRCQLRHGVHVKSLQQVGEEGSWRELLIEDRSASPADIAATRIDFQDWISGLSSRHRRMALLLASGEKTSIVARRFRMSAGRISQLRCRLRQAWHEFQGEACP